MKKYKALIIDDDTLFLTITRQYFKKIKDVISLELISDASSAKNYLHRCAARPDDFPELIFVDYYLAGMNGVDFALFFQNAYAELYPQTKIFILTSSISPSRKEKALSISVIRDVLVKPLSVDKFLQVAEKY